MAFIDYYKILGVNKDVSQSEIRAAYLKRTKQFHPDLHPDDPKAKAKFQALVEANAVLSDPEKRAKYDKYGEQWQNADAFEQAEHSTNSRGTHYYHTGGGDDDFEFSQFSKGTGGFSSFFENLFGKGSTSNPFQGTSQGMYVDPNEYDAHAIVNIDMYTALLGGEILLQTKTGKLKLKVKPETQNGTKIRIRGKGYQKPDGTFGNLIVSYNVKLPTQLTERQRDLLRKMREL